VTDCWVRKKIGWGGASFLRQRGGGDPTIFEETRYLSVRGPFPYGKRECVWAQKKKKFLRLERRKKKERRGSVNVYSRTKRMTRYYRGKRRRALVWEKGKEEGELAFPVRGWKRNIPERGRP